MKKRKSREKEQKRERKRRWIVLLRTEMKTGGQKSEGQAIGAESEEGGKLRRFGITVIRQLHNPTCSLSFYITVPFLSQPSSLTPAVPSFRPSSSSRTLLGALASVLFLVSHGSSLFRLLFPPTVTLSRWPSSLLF